MPRENVFGHNPRANQLAPVGMGVSPSILGRTGRPLYAYRLGAKKTLRENDDVPGVLCPPSGTAKHHCRRVFMDEKHRSNAVYHEGRTGVNRNCGLANLFYKIARMTPAEPGRGALRSPSFSEARCRSIQSVVDEDSALHGGPSGNTCSAMGKSGFRRVGGGAPGGEERNDGPLQG